MDFGWAIVELKKGERVARDGWNGKNMFLYHVPGSTFEVNRPPLSDTYPPGTIINYSPHIDMRAADGTCIPWTCSQADLFAEDWFTVNVKQKRMMESWQLRVVKEKAELEAKIAKLMDFLTDGEKFSAVSLPEHSRLAKQLDAMMRYSSILKDRIENF